MFLWPKRCITSYIYLVSFPLVTRSNEKRVLSLDLIIFFSFRVLPDFNCKTSKCPVPTSLLSDIFSELFSQTLVHLQNSAADQITCNFQPFKLNIQMFRVQKATRPRQFNFIMWLYSCFKFPNFSICLSNYSFV
jgi:hypothetical protein